MAAGYEPTAQDLRNVVSSLAANMYGLLARAQQVAQRLNDLGPAGIAALLGATDAATLQTFLGAMDAVLGYATTASANLTAADETAAGAAGTTLAVPAGSYGVVTADPALIALLAQVGHGDQLSSAIRALAPIAVI